MQTVDIHAAETQFSRLLDAAARRGNPDSELVTLVG